MNAPERIVPDATEPGILALHLKRYEFARDYCDGCEVLDAGCGVGYGSAFLAERATRVVGVDIDPDAIAYARERYAAPNIVFEVGDLRALDTQGSSFDVVCAFETIEHLPEPERFLQETLRVLRPEGLLIVSTPQAETTDHAPDNPFHEREYSRDDFEALLQSAFGEVELFGQRRVRTGRHRALQRLDVLGLRRRLPFLRRASRLLTGTPSMDAVTADEIVVSRDDLEDATELIAVCRR